VGDRVILHCDCNAFFASVETLMRPELARVPMAVAGDPEMRHGIILAKNELAKRYGVATAETINEARTKCPRLVLVPPHHDLYAAVSRRVNAIYLTYTDLVDPFGIDESFIDLTGSMHLFPGKTPKDIADEIRDRVRREVGITVSVGVSFCRVFAKLGSDYKKPDATTVIDRSNYKEIAWPLPVSDMLFAGRRTTVSLRALGVLTIGDLAAADRAAVVRRLGEAGDTLWRYANGLDNEPVRSYYERQKPKSVGNGMTFRRDIVGEAEIRTGVMALADQVAARLRRHGMKCTVLQVQIKDPVFHVVGKQQKLPRPTRLRQDLTETAMSLIKAAFGFGNTIRSLTLTASGLVEEGEGEQLALFDEQETARALRQEHVEETMESIRDRFGEESIRLGCWRDTGIGVGGHRVDGKDKNEKDT